MSIRSLCHLFRRLLYQKLLLNVLLFLLFLGRLTVLRLELSRARHRVLVARLLLRLRRFRVVVVLLVLFASRFWLVLSKTRGMIHLIVLRVLSPRILINLFLCFRLFARLLMRLMFRRFTRRLLVLLLGCFLRRPLLLLRFILRAVCRLFFPRLLLWRRREVRRRPFVRLRWFLVGHLKNMTFLMSLLKKMLGVRGQLRVLFGRSMKKRNLGSLSRTLVVILFALSVRLFLIFFLRSPALTLIRLPRRRRVFVPLLLAVVSLLMRAKLLLRLFTVRRPLRSRRRRLRPMLLLLRLRSFLSALMRRLLRLFCRIVLWTFLLLRRMVLLILMVLVLST